MTVEDLVLRLADRDTVVTIVRERGHEQIFHGPARDAIALGYGRYHISKFGGSDGLTWYW